MVAFNKVKFIQVSSCLLYKTTRETPARYHCVHLPFEKKNVL